MKIMSICIIKGPSEYQVLINPECLLGERCCQTRITLHKIFTQQEDVVSLLVVNSSKWLDSEVL